MLVRRLLSAGFVLALFVGCLLPGSPAGAEEKKDKKKEDPIKNNNNPNIFVAPQITGGYLGNGNYQPIHPFLNNNRRDQSPWRDPFSPFNVSPFAPFNPFWPSPYSPFRTTVFTPMVLEPMYPFLPPGPFNPWVMNQPFPVGCMMPDAFFPIAGVGANGMLGGMPMGDRLAARMPARNGGANGEARVPVMPAGNFGGFAGFGGFGGGGFGGGGR